MPEKIENMMHGEIQNFNRAEFDSTASEQNRGQDLSLPFKSIVKKMLSPNPDDRPDIDDIFRSSWFQQRMARMDINEPKKYRCKQKMHSVSESESQRSSYTNYSQTDDIVTSDSSQGDIERRPGMINTVIPANVEKEDSVKYDEPDSPLQSDSAFHESVQDSYGPRE